MVRRIDLEIHYGWPSIHSPEEKLAISLWLAFLVLCVEVICPLADVRAFDISTSG